MDISRSYPSPSTFRVSCDALILSARYNASDRVSVVIMSMYYNRNGSDKSGLFCVIWNVLERLRIDGEVAIPQTIRNLRHRRRQIIPNFVSASVLLAKSQTYTAENTAINFSEFLSVSIFVFKSQPYTTQIFQILYVILYY